MSTEVAGVSASFSSSYGGPGVSKSLVEATLAENAKQQALARAPLKIPDARVMFGIGQNINTIA